MTMAASRDQIDGAIVSSTLKNGGDETIAPFDLTVQC